MLRVGRLSRPVLTALAALLGIAGPAAAQHSQFATLSDRADEPRPPAGATVPALPAGARPLPINLPTALHLANVRPLDIAVASERIRVAQARLAQSRVLWLPTIYLGVDYFRHDGQIQDVAGEVFGTSKSYFQAGAGPHAGFAPTAPIYPPPAAPHGVPAP